MNYHQTVKLVHLNLEENQAIVVIGLHDPLRPAKTTRLFREVLFP